MIRVERFVNQLIPSNCYILVDDESGFCLCIDPASEKSEQEIAFISELKLSLDYVFITHEHTDHTWGVNALVEKYPSAKVICSEMCRQNLKKKTNQAYFRYFYDDPNYNYFVSKVDLTTDAMDWKMNWHEHIVVFIPTPGHSMGSVCLCVEGLLFTGDAILQSKPFINKRNGNRELFYDSVRKITGMYNGNTIVFPGHGDPFLLKSLNLNI